MTGNPHIAAAGRKAAGKIRTAYDARLEAAMRIIEEQATGPGIEGGRVTISALLQAGELSATFLEKRNRADTKLSVKKWIDRVNQRLAAGAKGGWHTAVKPESEPEKFTKLQNAYAVLNYKFIDQGTKLEKALDLVTTLNCKIEGLHRHIQEAGIPLPKDS